jgi:two-component system cell cycle sensor histidine kinase/response regulator CckA
MTEHPDPAPPGASGNRSPDRPEELLKRQLAELSVLHAVSVACISAWDEDEVIGRVTEIIGNTLYPANFGVALLDEETGTLHDHPSYRVRRGGRSLDLPLGRGVVGTVAQTGVPLRVGDVLREPVYVEGDPLTRSELCVPLKVGERTLGTINTESTELDAYSEADERLLATIAGLLALAIKRSRDERSLQQGQEHLKALIHGSPIPQFVIGRDHRVLYWNQALEELSNIRADEVVGTREHWKAFYLQERPCMADLLVDGAVSEVPSWYPSKWEKSSLVEEAYEAIDFFPKLGLDGRWLRFTAAAIRDSAGHLLGAIQTVVDITDKSRTEEALRKSEERYRSLFDGVPVGLYRTTSDGGILDANPALVEMLGYSDRRALLQMNAADFYLNQEDRKRLQELIERGDTVRDFEVQFRRRDGSIVWIRDNTRVIRDEQGGIQCFEGSLQDITERRRIEEQLVQTQKMESIGTLASGIAHDFNNMLGIILGNASVLAEMDVTDPRYHDRMQAIMETAQRGVVLVRQILTFARKTSSEREAVDPNSVIGELTKLLAETFPKTIRISLHLEQPLPRILMDRTQLHQAILNLCVNARDAMPNGGILTIRTRHVRAVGLAAQFPTARPVDHVAIRVADSGVGMDETTRQRIFEPFFTTKEKGRGTGLGLAVLYGIVQAHHGLIHVESQMGKGSAFELFFPVAGPADESALPGYTGIQEAPGGQETILVVEDEEFLQTLLTELLEEKGYRVLSARDGREAVRTFRKQGGQIDLVLTDLGLPGLSGQEVARTLREDDPDVKILVASGYFEPGEKSRLVAAGVTDFVQKPYSLNDLLQKVRDLLDRS